jgi:hypothetical protein
MEWAITAAIIGIIAFLGMSGPRKPAPKPRPDDKTDDKSKDDKNKNKGGGKPGNVDPLIVRPIDGGPEKPWTCPRCGKVFMVFGGAMPPKHPPCPWPQPAEPLKPIHVDPVGPDPKPQDPDPAKPTPLPTQGEYYQAVTNDKGDLLAAIAYAGGKDNTVGWKHRYWLRVQAAPENQWIAYNPEKGWTGAIIQHYSGWNTEFDSGRQFPVIFFPVLP